MVEIKEVKSKKDLKIFAGFNEKMYWNVPQAIPDLITDEIKNFTENKNPAYEYAKSRQFLAYKDGKCVGRIGAIISNKANKKWNRKRIRFTRVDFIDDYEVSKALFQAVENWGRKMGLEEIHGPMGFCDLDQQGMLIEGFEHEGIFITIHNAPYYKRHMENLGYQKSVDWVENRITIPKEIPDTLERMSHRVLKENHLTLVQVKNRFQLKKYIPQIFHLVNEAEKELYGEVDLTQAMIRKYVKQFLLMINVRYVIMVLDCQNNMVAISVSVPSMGQASKKSRGRLFPFGWARMLYAPFSKPEVLELYLIGVRDQYKNKGLPAVLIAESMKSAIADGIKYAETGPMLEENMAIQSLWKRFDRVQHRRRRCWIKKL